MLRSSCTIASLVHALLLGTVTVAGTTAASLTLVGCKDESQPEYWVEKLDDHTWRPGAVKRLEQFFDDAVTKANNDETAPEVKALADKIVEPLTRTYTQYYADLDTKTRVSLIKLLSGLRDKRTEPALKKALEEFAKRPKSTKDELDIKWAIRAVSDLQLTGLSDVVLQVFTKLKASTMLGGSVYRDFSESMAKMPQKEWAGTLKTMLEPEMKIPQSKKEVALIDAYRDQQFWQVTAAELLGRIGDAGSVEALMKVMLDPSKADVQPTAVLALVKIGKPAVDAAVKLLTDQDENLAAFHLRRVKEVTGASEAPTDKPYRSTAALILGTIGRSDATEPMITALKGNLKDDQKAVIARELTKLPITPESKAAFQAAFEGISIDASVPPGENALQMMAEVSGQFYDPDMIPWLLDRADKTKGSGDDLKALQGSLLVTALKLAKPGQLGMVKTAINRHGTQLEKDLYAQVDKLTKECEDKVACYLAAMEKSENQDQKNQFVGIKAGYMVGILGDSKACDELIAGLGSIDNAALRYVAAQVIDHLTPKGSKDVSEKLNAIITKNAKSPDTNKAAADAPLKQVMYRIESR
jgi:hypothetical protein